MRKIFSLTVLVACLTMARAADAATRTWTGTTSGNWHVAANWGGSLPVAGDDLVFPPGGQNQTMINDFPAGTMFHSLSLAGEYTVTGAAIVLGDGGIQYNPPNGSSMNTIDVALTLGAGQTWTISEQGLTVANGVHLNGHTLTVDTEWGGKATIAGVIDGTGAIVKNGYGVLTVSGNNTYAGPTTVNLGRLTVQHPHALGIADGSAANGTAIHCVDDQNGGTLWLDGVALGAEALLIDSNGLNSYGALGAEGVSSHLGPITLMRHTGIEPFLGATLTLAGPIGGTGGFDQLDSGTLVLAHPNNAFAGSVAATAYNNLKMLRVDADNAIPVNASLSFNVQSKLVINGHSQALDSLIGPGTVDLPTADSLISMTTPLDVANSFVNGLITGTGVFQYAGTGHYFVSTISANFTGSFRAASGILTISGSSPARAIAMPGSRLELAAGASVGRLQADGGTVALLGVVGAKNPQGVAIQLSNTSTFEPVSKAGSPTKLLANGQVVLGGSTLSLPLASSFTPDPGTAITLIANSSASPVDGTFAGLPEGATFTVNNLTFRISYTAGPGNNAVAITPLSTRTYLLSEGATNGFFTTDLLLANPNGQPAALHITFLKDDGTTLALDRTLAAMSHQMIRVNEVPGMESATFSTVVSAPADLPIAVERTMSWDRSGYGAHTEHATDGAATTWFFAEGSQGFFHTYLLLTNPQATQNVAHVDYLLEDGGVVSRSYTLGASSRLTVDLASEAAVQNRSFGMSVQFDQPGGAERAMYFGEAPLFNGGHESAGVNAPSTTWFLAEGATGPFFETFVLLANANDADASVTVTYLPSAGAPITAQKTVPAHGRLTINLETENPTLANAAVSTQIVSSLPIVVERSQYWPDPAPQWYEAHNSFGVTELATKWALAEGRVGAVDGIGGAQTYILLANPGTSAAQVSITFLRDSAAPVTKVFTVPPTSRFNVAVGPGTDVPDLTNEHFGALITADQPIAVERALYWDANGQVWAAGTNATAMRLP